MLRNGIEESVFRRGWYLVFFQGWGNLKTATTRISTKNCLMGKRYKENSKT
jgi:hypothetical protein